ncbi:MAG: CNNM domain-containing protein, partial [Planctomycetota bacterium]
MPHEIALFLVCLAFSACFSGSETALLTTNRLRLRRLAAEGDRSAVSILRLIHDPRRLLAGILVGNNIANTLAASVATLYCVERYGEATGLALATAAATVILVLFGEFLPKTIAAMRPEYLSRVMGGFMRWVLYLLSPVVAPLEALSRPLSALLRHRHEGLAMADLRL